MPAIGINHAADGNAGDELGIAHNHLRRAAVVVDQHDVANTSIGGKLIVRNSTRAVDD